MEEKEMVGNLLSAANWPIVGQICWVLGKSHEFYLYDVRWSTSK